MDGAEDQVHRVLFSVGEARLYFPLWGAQGRLSLFCPSSLLWDWVSPYLLISYLLQLLPWGGVVFAEVRVLTGLRLHGLGAS